MSLKYIIIVHDFVSSRGYGMILFVLVWAAKNEKKKELFQWMCDYNKDDDLIIHQTRRQWMERLERHRKNDRSPRRTTNTLEIMKTFNELIKGITFKRAWTLQFVLCIS